MDFFSIEKTERHTNIEFQFSICSMEQKKSLIEKKQLNLSNWNNKNIEMKKKLCKFYVDFVQWLQWKINFVFLRRKKILNWWVEFTHFLLVKKCIYWVWYSWNWLFSHSFEINLFFIQPFHFVCLSRRSDISIYLR